MKRALVIGGNGTLGKAVVAKLKDYSVEVITAGRQSGDVQVDMTSTKYYYPLRNGEKY